MKESHIGGVELGIGFGKNIIINHQNYSRTFSGQGRGLKESGPWLLKIRV